MTHRDGFPRFSACTRVARRCKGIASHPPRVKAMGRPKALGNRRSGRAGEPAAGESVGASASLGDAPRDPRLPSYPPVGPPVGPTDRPRDLPKPCHDALRHA